MYKFALMNDNNIMDMARLRCDAYPGFAHTTSLEQNAESIAEAHKRPDIKYYCAFKDDKIIGGFNMWDFEMNMRQTMIKAGGVGAIAVDLCHKKEKAAREIMRYFISSIRKKGANMALLYPFDSAFYHRMGFGFGTLLQQLRVRPSDLVGGDTKSHIQRLTEDSATMLADFYNSRIKSTHGLISKRAEEFATRLKTPANKIFAYVDNGIRGYIVFQFKKGSEESGLVNDISVSELLFDSAEVFLELMAFVKSQSDQIRYVIINTQDEGLIHTIPDPRNHMERMLFPVYQEVCRTGLGIMYRICDVEAFFGDIASCRFGNLNMTLRVNIHDSFVPENNKPFLLSFNDGLCKVVASTTPSTNNNIAPDAELSIDIAEFSSLIMGTVSLTSLVKYGKAQLSNESYLDVLSRSFSLDEKPICLTYF
ncbi:MAG: GNAT family N-acetyltransferase [Defluviitaleaceae bacterium]|nr:GNAT family N-acetyltransferase [Defluviitaleaceae bacterium]